MNVFKMKNSTLPENVLMPSVVRKSPIVQRAEVQVKVHHHRSGHDIRELKDVEGLHDFQSRLSTTSLHYRIEVSWM